MNEYVKNILTAERDRRQNEVTNYQINIDNYRLAIAEIDATCVEKPHMVEFRTRLQHLLDTSIQEQEKEAVLLKVISRQLEAADVRED